MKKKQIIIISIIIFILAINFIINASYDKIKKIPIHNFQIDVSQKNIYNIKLPDLSNNFNYRIDLIDKFDIYNKNFSDFSRICYKNNEDKSGNVKYFNGSIDLKLLNQDNKILQEVLIDDKYCKENDYGFILFQAYKGETYYINLDIIKPDKEFQAKFTPELLVAQSGLNRDDFTTLILNKFFIISILLISFLIVLILSYFVGKNKKVVYQKKDTLKQQNLNYFKLTENRIYIFLIFLSIIVFITYFTVCWNGIGCSKI